MSHTDRNSAHSGQHELERRLAANWPVREWCDSHVVLAVSGGADSVAMLRAVVALKKTAGGTGKLYAAHLNHGLRGIEADADEAWLKVLCAPMDVPLEAVKADVTAIAALQGDGWEAAARTARYEFLQQTAERLGARFVATAHTADDQVETVLQRILRGTGLKGLAGIPFTRPLSESVSLVRPLLTLRRQDILAYLAALGQDYRTDSSNADPRWTRNRLRHELLPLLRERYGADVDAALVRLAAQANEAQQIIANRATGVARECVAVDFNGPTAACARIDCRKLAGQPAIIIREVCKLAWAEADWSLQAMGYSEWQQLADMAFGSSEQPSINLPENIRARRDKQLLVLEAPGLT